MTRRNYHSSTIIVFLASLIRTIFPANGFSENPRNALIPSSDSQILGRFRWQRTRLSNVARIEEEPQTVPTYSSDAESTPESNSDRNAHILISIGPPCSNKKDALESYLLSEGHELNDENTDVYRDINLREQSKGVYHRIPLAAFIYPTTRLTKKLGSKILYSDVTVRDRLFDPDYEKTDSEIRNVILRLAGRITPDEFAERVREQALKAGDNVEYFKRRRIEICEDLIRAVEEVSAEAIGEVLVQMQLKLDQASAMDDELPYEDERGEQETILDLRSVNATSAQLMSAKALIKTPHVELYVPQCIFSGGIDRAEELLETLLLKDSSMMPMAWENTNTRPSEYVAALSAAEKAKRPVKFISWGTQWLPRISRKDLLKRNVIKFRQTGRYIPAVSYLCPLKGLYLNSLVF